MIDWGFPPEHLDTVRKLFEGRRRCVCTEEGVPCGGQGHQGELNLGQLVRERYRKQSVSIGFSTYTGTVTAASEWDGPAERKHVRPALPGSYEALFHSTGMSKFLLLLNEHDKEHEEARSLLREPRLERAIGVIYQPRSERKSHYFHAQLRDQFDAILHFDETRAVSLWSAAPFGKQAKFQKLTLRRFES